MVSARVPSMRLQCHRAPARILFTFSFFKSPFTKWMTSHCEFPFWEIAGEMRFPRFRPAGDAEPLLSRPAFPATFPSPLARLVLESSRLPTFSLGLRALWVSILPRYRWSFSLPQPLCVITRHISLSLISYSSSSFNAMLTPSFRHISRDCPGAAEA